MGSCWTMYELRMVLRNPYGPRTKLRLITVGLHTDVHKPVRHPQAPVWCLHLHCTRRVDVRILTIPKNTDNPQNAHMHVTMHIKRLISYGLPKGHRPVWLPKSYGPGPVLVTCIRAFYGLSACTMVMGVQDTVRVPYRFRKVHVRAP